MNKQTKLEKILNPWVLLGINIAIILATELSGERFMTSGAIHLIALFFVLLGVSRIFIHYDVYDRYMRLLIGGGAMALVIFSLSHLVEFLGFVYFKTYEDTIFVNVVNFYIMSMLVVTLGAEYFLNALKKNLVTSIGILAATIPALFVLTIFVYLKKISVSLESTSLLVYVYVAVILVTLFFSVRRLVEIKKQVPIMTNFVNYFIAAFALIAVSALQYVLYDVLLSIGIPTTQIMYVSHFLFYGALSLIFLAFARLTNLGGVYADVETYIGEHPEKKFDKMA